MPENKITRKAPYIIADLCLNHEGDLGLCKEMTLKAKEAGCDAVKIQCLDYDDGSIKSVLESKISMKKFEHLNEGELLESLLLSDNETADLVTYCKTLDIDLIATIYGFRHIDLLDQLGVDKYKIASQDLIHLKLLKEVAKKSKPMIVSIGMGTMREVENAVETIRSVNSEELILLHCVSLYPPDDSEMNLKRITTLKNIFDFKIGFSDHTIGITAAIVATALGAEVIERHFTYDKKAEGWDHALSSDYDEIRFLCSETRRVGAMLGDTYWKPNDAEMGKREKMRRSIVTKKKIKKGEKITDEYIDFKRPGSGIRPDEVKYIINRRVNRDIEADELILWDDLDN